MQKTKQFINKYWFILVIILITVVRLLLSCNFPSFYITNLRYDDKLMINEFNSLKEGNYLGEYKDITLVKGVVFPAFLYIANLLNTSYSMLLTIVYTCACLFFIISLKKIVKDKLMLIAIYILLVLNPISYSSDLFQRLYRNALSITELLFFFGCIVNIISSKKNRIINYLFLGLITGIMFLTREDNIWVVIVYGIVALYKLYKNFKIKNIIKVIVPLVVTAAVLNIVCYINFKQYGTYTYNELSNSNFKKAYIKILQIKDDEKIDKTAIPRSTLEKLSEKSEVFNLSKDYINMKYMKLAKENGQIYNGNMIWYLRYWLYDVNNIKTGEEANRYFETLSNEIDKLFEEGKLEKEFVIPSININTPTLNEVKELPKNLFDAIVYTTTYKNVKTYSTKDIEEKFKFDENVKAYYINYKDYHNAENIIENNLGYIEMMRNLYKYFTIIFSVIALIIYLRNIKIKDKLNLLTHIVFLTYLVILCGVTYTHTTAFDAIRYCYLGNVYILQNLFIMLNIVRIYKKYCEKIEINEIKLLESGGQELINKNVSVIMPAYNEENGIKEAINEVVNVMKENNIYEGSEIIVVNDGSTDNTENIAIESGAIVIDNPQNMGYGYSLKKGIKNAKNEIIVITDSDLTYPFAEVIKMLKIKEKGFDLIVGARTGKYYKESVLKSFLRKILKGFVEFISGKKIKDINSGLRVFDKTTVMKYFPRLCNTFSFTTSQTLAYMMNDLTVCYIDIPYNKRKGKSKVKLVRDSIKSIRYILEAGIYYNPLKVFTLLTIVCIVLSIIGFFVSHFARINAGYILGIGGLLVSIIVFSLGILSALLKQIMDK